ncbi:universal stress protein [Micropruina sonneratiae]|uniref:universal stress protein n=1 Tax=Micropruina sonneratiae TaxID=2986940 RepID=UPI002226C789|nr:universal stress protein [Micropruina sp. KQZ13P-5]MCW3159312.1 universal stress protein [Micropruina sp. KQZ13P-5]
MDVELPIVVGNDGSDFALLALDRALWLGRQLKTEVRVIRAWSISTAPRPSTWSPGYVPPADDFEVAVRERLQRDVAATLADYSDVSVTLETPHGPAGRELLKAAEQARVLVVGTRGAGGFKGLLMGSVSNQVVEHAACDVLVVRRGINEMSPDRRLKLDRFLDQ